MKTRKHIHLDKQALRDLELKHGIKGMGRYFDLSPRSSTHLKISPLMLFTLADFFADQKLYPDDQTDFTDVQSTIWKGLYSAVNSDNTSVKLAEFDDSHGNDAHYETFSAALRKLYNEDSSAFSLYLLGEPGLLGRINIDYKTAYRNHPIFSDLFLAWILIGDDDEKKKEFTVRYFKKIKELAQHNKEAMQELRESGMNPYDTPMGRLRMSRIYICQESDSTESLDRDMRNLLEGKRKVENKETVSSSHEVAKITYEDFGNEISPYTLEELVEVFQRYITKAILTERGQAHYRQSRFDDNKRYLLELSVARTLGVFTCNSLHGEAWSSKGNKLAINVVLGMSEYYMWNQEATKGVNKANNARMMVVLTSMSCYSAIYLYKDICSFDSKPAIVISSLLLAAHLYVGYEQSKAVYDDYVGRS